MSLQRDPLNAFLDLPQASVPHAKSGPLAGLRLAVKDIFDVAGYKTGCGNPQRYEDAAPAEKTAPAVQVILDAGAEFVGKTQTDELAFSLMGQNAHFPHPVNPSAPDRVTGGSSSGSAAAVAGGLADIATGSDTGGSIRAPASFCGLIGLRTTHGRISLDGTMPLAPSLDTFGWFARDIGTYEKVAAVVLGAAPISDAGAAPHPLPVKDGERGAPTLVTPSPRPSRGEGKGEGQFTVLTNPLRLAALDSLVLGPIEAAEYRRMTAIVAAVIGEPATAPALSHSIDDLYWCFRKLQAYEAWAAHGDWILQRDRGLGPGVRERFEFGSTLDSEVAAAETQRRNAFRAELAALLGQDGVLVLPTVPSAAPLKDSPAEDLQAYRERALRLLCLSGLSGFPQITLPIGEVHGAPFGISLLGPAGSDLALIKLGRRVLEAAGKA
ncbi:amidase family protein [Allomesorhizobium alhagi]|jgi:amidase|uniref:Amidase n=1 Tax=Mesorhizobium alhagi CCNWXJ12-2 TaxID=1107882 RepID=H0HNS9_9HYPH|nr:amidase family protein [Mesorhizobium alhagi]EHK57624.1 amidase [Mesorhizobium alhagi CCNWXJ12-2]